MNKNKKELERMYSMLVDYEKTLHEKNQKRIHVGILCLYIIPIIFLMLVFLTDSSKVIFLTLWIVSLFGIGIYLLMVEYNDYNLQHRMKEITGDEGEIDSLLSFDEVEEKMRQVVNEMVEKRRLEEEEEKTEGENVQ